MKGFDMRTGAVLALCLAAVPGAASAASFDQSVLDEIKAGVAKGIASTGGKALAESRGELAAYLAAQAAAGYGADGARKLDAPDGMTALAGNSQTSSEWIAVAHEGDNMAAIAKIAPSANDGCVDVQAAGLVFADPPATGRFEKTVCRGWNASGQGAAAEAPQQEAAPKGTGPAKRVLDAAAMRVIGEKVKVELVKKGLSSDEADARVAALSAQFAEAVKGGESRTVEGEAFDSSVSREGTATVSVAFGKGDQGGVSYAFASSEVDGECLVVNGAANVKPASAPVAANMVTVPETKLCAGTAGTLTTRELGWGDDRLFEGPDGNMWARGMWAKMYTLAPGHNAWSGVYGHKAVESGEFESLLAEEVGRTHLFGNVVPANIMDYVAHPGMGAYEWQHAVAFGGRVNLPEGSHELHLTMDVAFSHGVRREDDCVAAMRVTTPSGERRHVWTKESGARIVLPVNSGDDVFGVLHCQENEYEDDPRDHWAGDPWRDASRQSAATLEIVSFPHAKTPRAWSVEKAEFLARASDLPSDADWAKVEASVADLVSAGKVKRGLAASWSKAPESVMCKTYCNETRLPEAEGPLLAEGVALGEFRAASDGYAAMVSLDGFLSLPEAKSATFAVTARRGEAGGEMACDAKIDVAGINVHRSVHHTEAWDGGEKEWNAWRLDDVGPASSFAHGSEGVYPFAVQVACATNVEGGSNHGVPADRAGILADGAKGAEIILWVKTDKDEAFRPIDGRIAFHR